LSTPSVRLPCACCDPALSCTCHWRTIQRQPAVIQCRHSL
jgi:hypothetical protein